MAFTEEQQAAIDLRQCNLLVSAAAGSGKTAVLVERINRLLRNGEARLDELLIVTFTNAAAQEMRERILKANPEQYSRLSDASICTFHAFALGVVRRYFHLIDLAPGFRLCDETRQKLMQEEVLEELFREGFEREDVALRKLCDWYAGARSDEPVRRILRETRKFLQSLPDPDGWLRQAVRELHDASELFPDGPLGREIAASIDERLERAETAATDVHRLLGEAALPLLAAKAGADLLRIQAIRDAYRQDFDRGGEAVRSLSESKWETFRATKEEKVGYESLKEEIGSLREAYKAIVKDIGDRYAAESAAQYAAEIEGTAEIGEALAEWVGRFDARYAEKKKRRGLIDFSDIEHFALRILENEAAADEYRRKFRYLFVDEYQDSNLVQETLIRRISRPDNLFMVGDVKQSIYKFRLAEPEIFLEKYAVFAADRSGRNRKIDLNRNFRSKAAVVQTVNQVFSSAMTRSTAGIDYAESGRLIQGAPQDDACHYPTVLHLMDSGISEDAELDDEIRGMKQVEAEAELAAGLIAQHLGRPVFDVKQNRVRPLARRDMVILLRSTSRTAEAYYQALQGKGIAAHMDAGDGYFDTLEISVFVNLLRLIDNRRQDVPLLSVLRSPIGGFSVEELAEIRIASRKTPYYQAFRRYAEEENNPLAIRCRDFAKRLDLWNQWLRGLALEDFVWKLMQETGYYLYVGSLPAGDQRQANLRALADRAATYEASRPAGLSGFLEYADAIMKGSIAVPPVKLLSESDDVVRIMTVHKSKGLEFPFVLVGNLGRRFRHDAADVLSLHRSVGLGLQLVDRGRRQTRRPLLMQAAVERKMKENLAEEVRILYVALTRAMDQLILLGTVANPADVLARARYRLAGGIKPATTYLDYILPLIGRPEGIEVAIHDRASLPRSEKRRASTAGQMRTLWEKGFPQSFECSETEEVYRRLNWRYPYGEAVQLKSKFSVTELSKKMTAEEDAASVGRPTGAGLRPALSGMGGDAALRGTAYHRVMEQFPFHPEGCSEAEIAAFLTSLTEREILTPQEAALIDPTVLNRFSVSPLGREIGRADRLWREWPFNILQQTAGEPIMVQGVIDCCFRLDGRYTLIDYKTDRLWQPGDRERLTEFYRTQIAAYRDAVERLKGVRIDRACLVFLDTGELSEIDRNECPLTL